MKILRFSKRSPLITILFAGVLAGIFAGPVSAQPAQPVSASWNAAEREAANVVALWVAGWSEKNIDKIAATMTEDCEYRLDPAEEAKHGRLNFIADARPLLPNMNAMTITKTYSMGNDVNVVVLIERVDDFTLLGKRTAVPVATLFRVQRGKIVQLFDIPLIDLAPLLPAPAPKPAVPAKK